jgi:DNA-binding transcriptional ArsR family regulator
MGNRDTQEFFGIKDLSVLQHTLLNKLFSKRVATGYDLWALSGAASISNVLFNLKVLRDRGIITKQRRGKNVLYMFNGGVLKEIANQIEELKEHGK